MNSKGQAMSPTVSNDRAACRDFYWWPKSTSAQLLQHKVPQSRSTEVDGGARSDSLGMEVSGRVSLGAQRLMACWGWHICC